MNDEQRKRGRPRAYDPKKALSRARDVFWDTGFAASSLDDLGSAMSMNRPSLYGAFGDKQALYLRTLELYRDEGLAAMQAALDPVRSLREGLAAVYAAALDTYLGGAHPRGCFLIGTAVTESVRSDTIRERLLGSLHAFDEAIETRMRLAVADGELAADADVPVLARLASGVMYSLAVRARIGEPRHALEAIASGAIDLICGRRD
jgi:AcrR family transcriptional regulator